MGPRAGRGLPALVDGYVTAALAPGSVGSPSFPTRTLAANNGRLGVSLSPDLRAPAVAFVPEGFSPHQSLNRGVTQRLRKEAE